MLSGTIVGASTAQAADDDDAWSGQGKSFTSTQTADGTFLNAIIGSDVPDVATIRIPAGTAGASIDTYYMISTTMELTPGAPILRSYDLVNWEIVNYVYDVMEVTDTNALRNGYSAYGQGQWASTLRYHDGTFSSFRDREWGAPIPAAVPSWRLVTFAQDHDQIGNRAAGDRLSQSLSAERLEVAAVLTMTAPGTPMLFMGEEWGASTPWQFFTSHPEPELAAANRAGRTAEFARMGWDEALVPDPNDPATFERSKLDWAEPGAGVHARLLELYRALSRLRRARPELTDPDRRGHGAESAGPGRWVLRRDAAAVYVNLSPEPWSIDLDGREVWLATSGAPAGAADAGALVLPADTAAVVGPVSR